MCDWLGVILCCLSVPFVFLSTIYSTRTTFFIELKPIFCIKDAIICLKPFISWTQYGSHIMLMVIGSGVLWHHAALTTRKASRQLPHECLRHSAGHLTLQDKDIPALNDNSQPEQYEQVRTIMRLARHALRLGLGRSERTVSRKSIFTRRPWQSSRAGLIVRGRGHYL